MVPKKASLGGFFFESNRHMDKLIRNTRVAKSSKNCCEKSEICNRYTSQTMCMIHNYNLPPLGFVLGLLGLKSAMLATQPLSQREDAGKNLMVK